MLWARRTLHGFVEAECLSSRRAIGRYAAEVRHTGLSRNRSPTSDPTTATKPTAAAASVASTKRGPGIARNGPEPEGTSRTASTSSDHDEGTRVQPPRDPQHERQPTNQSTKDSEPDTGGPPPGGGGLSSMSDPAALGRTCSPIPALRCPQGDRERRGQHDLEREAQRKCSTWPQPTADAGPGPATDRFAGDAGHDRARVPHPRRPTAPAAYDRPTSDMNPRQDDGACADPRPVVDLDWLRPRGQRTSSSIPASGIRCPALMICAPDGRSSPRRRS